MGTTAERRAAREHVAAYHELRLGELLAHVRIDVALERGTGAGHGKGAPGTAQQRGTDLGFKAGKCPRHARLADLIELAYLGLRHAISNLLEPALRSRVHIHDDSAWKSCQVSIGRIDRCQEHLMACDPTTALEATAPACGAVRARGGIAGI
jgi:hypothetical protein